VPVVLCRCNTGRYLSGTGCWSCTQGK
jgi:hypothetical protein